MRLPVFLLLLLTAGCIFRRHTPAAPASAHAPVSPTARTNLALIVTPGQATTGRVASVNTAGRFVVLTFPLGTMPALEKRMSVYRSGLKVGEVKITGPQLDINIDADIVTGDCRVGDEVREE
jgi:hypothetical protein